MDTIYVAGLQSIKNIGSVTIRSLVGSFGSAERVWQASVDDIRSTQVLTGQAADEFVRRRSLVDINSLYEALQRERVSVISYWDDEYPLLLQGTYNPPAVLFYKGKLPPTEKTLAVVGSRKATAYGKNVCAFLVEELAAAQVCIVSGGARGIDSASHESALKQGSTTIAVLASGLDTVYPPENKNLFCRIAEQGALVSEYPLGVQPLAQNFPARNRIISGMARGVLVIEAAERSGTLITADFSLEEGRDVFAVPGSIFSSSSKGTNQLLRQGAIPVTSALDILQEYDWLAPVKSELELVMECTLEEHCVLSVLSMETAQPLDMIIAKTRLPLSAVNMILLHLELSDYVKNIGNQQYIRCSRR